MQVLDEHTRSEDFANLLAPLLAGNDTGLLSEAGCPAIADPGAELVRIAHQKNIRVVPLVGPSSILLALMASGLNGQRFMFHGYLPVKPQPRGLAFLPGRLIAGVGVANTGYVFPSSAIVIPRMPAITASSTMLSGIDFIGYE